MATIQGVYVALFGRPADPLGLAYFNGVTQNGANLTAIGDLASTPEYQSRFVGQGPTQIINTIYQTLFNRDADAAGLTFFANQLVSGKVSINNIAINILDGAQGTDKTIVDTKIAAANAFTAAVDTGPEIVGYSGPGPIAQGRAFLAPITTTAPTAAQVNAAVATATTTTDLGGTGNILTLTAGADVFDPSQTNLAFKTTANNDTIRALNTQVAPLADDLSSTDVINGGGGTDTLNATIDLTPISAVITSVEKINLTTTVNGANFDMTNVTGTTDLTVTGGFTAAVVNTNSATTYGIVNGVAGADQLTVVYKDATGTSDVVKLVSTNNLSPAAATASKFVVDGIETANVTVNGTGTGAQAIDVGASGAGASTLKVVTLAGTSSGQVTLTDTNSVTTITTVDASGLTKAGLTFNAGGYTKLATLTGGAGADALTLTTNTGVKVTGGAGADVIDIGTGSATLVFKAGDSTLTNGADTITNFTTGTDKIDLTAFTLNNKTAIGTSALATPAGDVAGLFTVGGTQYSILKINAGADIAVDVNNDGNFSAGTDLYIKGVGTAVLNDFTLV